MADLEKVERFHRLKNRIDNIVLKTIGEKEIITGERAVEVRVPPHLRRHTRDYDVFSDTPKQDAEEAEEELDEEFGGDFFEVVPAIHPGTHKVKSKIDGRTYADFSKPNPKEGKINPERIMGKNYASVEFLKRRLRAILKDKTQEFRHAKDRDTLNRIAIHEKNIAKQSLGKLLNQKKKQNLMNFISNKKKTNLINSNFISRKGEKINFLK